ncbi:kazal-type proteinase inhibitor 1 (macronuclear) [Tetrahymena thermophila SB210]|uniref:Kazal-type proteinase inhibitor 1 n=1 Tax=Tetrahymena thermophila (strain SB210) TaxID=312017 RepID=Q23RZ2_TETTS|nr:kazal-type proteinase inhibitor 1 [Tetrahymena thermophila SB210]EAR99247.1 kazal-type proteinase inhibitor 1 [Tetrahymena thermophila SB210]|eukprot:XP_001019492.1 kazal-type proteinase inhibitor 1 [Tetrahymena thermophila SB210]
MKTLLITLAIISLCAAENIKCTEQQKKAEACTYEYEPVCGVKVDQTSLYIQSKETYGNKCSACATEGVEFYAVGKCEEYPENAVFCHPDISSQQLGCTREYYPVCGYFDESIKCRKAPCGSNYSNKCAACINKEVNYYLNGFC